MFGGKDSKAPLLLGLLGAGALVLYFANRRTPKQTQDEEGAAYRPSSKKIGKSESDVSIQSLVGNAPRPMVICGPSGVGKGTLLDRLFKDFPGQFSRSVSHTTRPPRAGEVDGVHYNFTTLEQMKQDVADGKFIEHADVHGKMYGTSFQAVKDIGDKGQICILEIDVQGVESIRNTDLSPYFVYIFPPSHESLRQRLTGRGTETKETLEKRLAGAFAELDYMKENEQLSNCTIVNDDLDKAYSSLTEKLYEFYPNLSKITKKSSM